MKVAIIVTPKTKMWEDYENLKNYLDKIFSNLDKKSLTIKTLKIGPLYRYCKENNIKLEEIPKKADMNFYEELDFRIMKLIEDIDGLVCIGEGGINYLQYLGIDNLDLKIKIKKSWI